MFSHVCIRTDTYFDKILHNYLFLYLIYIICYTYVNVYFEE